MWHVARHKSLFHRVSYFLKLNTCIFSLKMKIFIKNLWECERFSTIRLIKEFPTKNWKKDKHRTTLRKLWTTGSIEHRNTDVNFINSSALSRVFTPVSTCAKRIKINQVTLSCSLIEIKVACFYGTRCSISCWFWTCHCSAVEVI